MKKIIFLIVTTVMLTGCMSINSSKDIISLLSSPQLSQRETLIVASLSEYKDEEVVLKYLKGDGNTTPIQYLDMDGDGVNEAITFYKTPNSSEFVRMAVLRYEDDVWKVKEDVEGYGTEILKVNSIVMDKEKGKQLLVCYTYPNTLEKLLSIYYIDEFELSTPFMVPCQEYITRDMTEDGMTDIIIADVNSDNKFPSIQLISLDANGALDSIAQHRLNVANVNITGLTLSQTDYSDEIALLIDYRNNSYMTYTEAVVYRQSNDPVKNAGFELILENDVVRKIWEESYTIQSRDVNKDGYLETATIIDQNKSEYLTFMEWTSFLREPYTRVFYGICDTLNGFFISLPDEWQNLVTPVAVDDLHWEIIDDETQNIKFSVTIIEPSEMVYPKEEDVIVNIGVLRAHIKFSSDVTIEEKQYIIHNTIYLK